MIICIADVLSSAELASIRQGLAGLGLVDGTDTAGWYARDVKHNRQVDPHDPAAASLQSLVTEALARNVLFQLAARPRAIRPILFNLYEPGMSYGSHVDDALMGTPPAFRSDLSLTLFLGNPADYDGGDLLIETTAGDQAFRLPAGSLVLYPSSSLHRVEPVTRGVRRAAVTWVQSLVRDAGQRELLFDLDTARRSLFDREGKSREFDLLTKTLANLLRMWAEP